MGEAAPLLLSREPGGPPRAWFAPCIIFKTLRGQEVLDKGSKLITLRVGAARDPAGWVFAWAGDPLLISILLHTSMHSPHSRAQLSMPPPSHAEDRHFKGNNDLLSHNPPYEGESSHGGRHPSLSAHPLQWPGTVLSGPSIVETLFQTHCHHPRSLW